MRLDVTALARFYERLLGWQMRALSGPRPGTPSGDGWAQLRSPDGSLKIEIQFDQHYVRPVWPGVAGAQGMQMHLDFRVDDVPIGVEWAIACAPSESARGLGAAWSHRRALSHWEKRCDRQSSWMSVRTSPPAQQVNNWFATLDDRLNVGT